MKSLLLLGAGHAHVHVLSELARERLPGVEVTLVAPFSRQMYSGMVPGMVAGHYDAAQCAIELAPLVKAAGVPFLQTAAVALNAAAREVVLSDGRTVSYDVLSLDVGAVMDRDLLPGAREHALWVRPIEHFVHWVNQLVEIASKRALDVVVVGAGAAGVELAAALQFRLDQRRVGGAQSRVILVAGTAGVLAGYPPAVVRRALKALLRLRVVVLNEVCTQISADHVHLGNGARLASDAPVMCLGAQAPSWLQASGLALDEFGFVQTGATLQSVSHPMVFAAGDVASRIDAPHPRSGVYAVRAGPPLAANLRRYLAGAALQTHQPQKRTLNLLSCGERSAVASWGRFSARGRWVWWWKDRIDRAFVARYSQVPPD